MVSRNFTTADWVKGSNVYEVNIRQYTAEGTFNAFHKHLPRLKEMGVEILWFMPVTPISEKGKKGSLGSYYACSSYTTVNSNYGSLDDFKRVVTDAHRQGMKVIIDWVANHTGRDHEWTLAHPEFYYQDERGEFYDRNGWDDVIDLNYSSAVLRSEMIKAMRYWVTECDIDGFRCDMAHLVPLDFWHQARKSCDELKSLFWLAETDNITYHEVFDASYAWHWMHTSERYFRGETNLHDFISALMVSEQLPADCFKLMFTTNHDENSWNGTEFEKYGAAVKAMAVLCYTWKALPLLYSGQELPNHKRLKFFDKDEIEWNENVQMHSFYQSLLLLRKNSAAIAEGELKVLHTDANDKLLIYIRRAGADVVLTLLNLSASEKVKVHLNHPLLKGSFANVFSGLSYSFEESMEFELSSWEYFVYKKV